MQDTTYKSERIAQVSKDLKIGNVFTPLEWAIFAIENFSFFENGFQEPMFLSQLWVRVTYWMLSYLWDH
jgi:hypothetical protein